MQRIGIFTGKLYSQKRYDNGEIHECVICVDPALREADGIIISKELASVKKILECTNCNKPCEEKLKDSRLKHIP